MDCGAGHIYNGATNVIGPWSINTTTTIALLQSGGFSPPRWRRVTPSPGAVVYEATS